MVDVNLLESMFQIMGPLPAVWKLLGIQPPRLGSGIPYSVPRGTYMSADGQWLAISSSTDSVAQRVMELVGLGHDPGLATSEGRIARRGEVDDHVREWIAARPAADVLQAFIAADAAIAPVMNMAELLADPHAVAREILTEVDGNPMQNLVARLSATPGRIRWAGREEGPA